MYNLNSRPELRAELKSRIAEEIFWNFTHISRRNPVKIFHFHNYLREFLVSNIKQCDDFIFLLVNMEIEKTVSMEVGNLYFYNLA